MSQAWADCTVLGPGERMETEWKRFPHFALDGRLDRIFDEHGRLRRYVWTFPEGYWGPTPVVQYMDIPGEVDFYAKST